MPSLSDPATLRRLLAHLHEGLYIGTSAGQLLEVSPAVLELFGVESIERLRDRPAEDLWVDPGRRTQELELLQRDGAVRDFELELRRADGQIRTVLDRCMLITEANGERWMLGALTDVTRRKQLERELHELSSRDPLTGCYNRRHLTELRSRLETESGRWGAIVTDLDGFKAYNDQFGSQAGDEALVRFSRFLSQRVRAEDPVVRMGGDQFLILVLSNSAVSTPEVAHRLKVTAERSAPLPFSLGWAVRGPGETLESTIQRADRELVSIRIQSRQSTRAQ